MDDQQLDKVLGAIRAKPPPEQAPEWPEEEAPSRRRWWGVGVAMAAVVLLSVWRLVDQGDEVTFRGEEGGVVGLQVAVERGGTSARLQDRAAVGERLMFQVQSTASAPVWLWVEGPSGREALAEQLASEAPEAVRTSGGLLGYRLVEPGRYTFSASLDPRVCSPPACARRVVDVE